MEPKLRFIREEYFKENIDFVKMLDAGNASKQLTRTHICVLIAISDNKF